MEGVGWWPLPTDGEAQRVVSSPACPGNCTLPLGTTAPTELFPFLFSLQSFDGWRGVSSSRTLVPSVADGGAEALTSSLFARERDNSKRWITRLVCR